MYQIQKENYGYKLTFEGFIYTEEMEHWVEESNRILPSTPTKFGFFVDMRLLKPISVGAQSIMQKGQRLYKQRGMQRSVVIVENAITKIQFVRIANQSGIYDKERYIDASAILNWEKMGVDWILKKIDPEISCFLRYLNDMK